MYCNEVVFESSIESKGKRNKGTNDVAANGNASVIHQMAINNAAPAILFVDLAAFKGSNIKKKRNTNNPTYRPILSIISFLIFKSYVMLLNIMCLI